MLHVFDNRPAVGMRTLNWRGRSGRLYAMQSENLERFAFKPGELYLVALRDLVLWVGSADDLIADYQSRSRFRLALDCADRVFRVEATTDELERLTMVWDLEGAEPLMELSAA